MGENGGWSAIPHWIIRDTDISAYALLVYMSLSSHVGRGGIWPSMRTVAKESRCSETQVRRALRELVDEGLIAVVPRTDGNGGSLSNSYVLLPQGGATQAPPPASQAGRGCLTGREGGACEAPEEEPIEEEPVKENMYAQPALSSEVEALTEPVRAPMPSSSRYFDEFWDKWPRKVGKNAAWKSWQAIMHRQAPPGRGLLAHRIIDAACRYAMSPNLPDTQFIPYPATWLNQGRWDDDLEASCPAPARSAPPSRFERNLENLRRAAAEQGVALPQITGITP